MDKIISPMPIRLAVATTFTPPRGSRSESFSDVLEGFIQEVKPRQNSVSAPGTEILVGKITTATQTVSELLMQHKELKNSVWDILNSKQNLNKNYTNIQPGTDIYYNTKKGTLTWKNPGHSLSASGQPEAPIYPQPSSPGRSVNNNRSGSYPASTSHLGVISEELPTVSHLLKAHPSLHRDTWNIVSSAVNRDKDFTHLSPDTVVTFDPTTGEITWQPSGQKRSESSVPILRSTLQEAAPLPKTAGDTGIEGSPLLPGAGPPVMLGRIDEVNTTVSHLLTNHPQLRNRTWEILASGVNQDKDFHRIANGTEIYLQPENMEIILGSVDTGATILRQTASSETGSPKQNHTAPEHTGSAADLSEAVRPFLGTSYKEIDCYELLVKGLRRMDIPYGGRDGLYTKLTRMARDEGMPINAYLNGEGIVKASGSLVLSNNYRDMENWQQEAETLIRKMEPLLDKGQILSFSTENRGHTGIVSQLDNRWTFINSGRLDNSVASDSVRHGVGEEILHKEINNWFRLAHAKRETLTVTLGRLEHDKIRTAYNFSDSLTKRI